MVNFSAKPVLTGGIYCAPWCGFKCTKAAHDKAVRDGATLAKKMGKGWTSQVWENMGWHYKVQSPCRRIRIHPSIWGGKVVGYTAFLGERDECGGRWAEHGRTPSSSLRMVVNAAKASLAEIGAMIEGL